MESRDRGTMESHILNSYHQARYRIHDHNRMGSTSESYSSESSGTQNSPDYPEKFAPQVPAEEARETWKATQNGDAKVSIKSEDINESSSDDEVSETAYPKPENEAYDHNQYSEINEKYYSQDLIVASNDDYEIVVDGETPDIEGQIIQVFAVDPNLDLEGSDEEQEQEQDNESSHKRVITDDEGPEYIEEVDYTENLENAGYSNTASDDNDNLGINMDAPVVSNVDEYFIKQPHIKTYEKNVPKDQPVISDVDEYFIKDSKSLNPAEEVIAVPNVDDFFVKDLKKEAENLNIVGDVPNVDDFFNKVEVKSEPLGIKTEIKTEIASTPCLEPDNLPHIEHIKRFLLGDMPCPKLQSKTVERSSLLPHSAAQFNYLIDDAKGSPSFEDLNLDLPDLGFEECKGAKNFVLPPESSKNKRKNVPLTLTEEDVNSFLIKSKQEIERAFDDSKEEDDFRREDLDMYCSVEFKKQNLSIETQFPDNKTSALSTDEPVPAKTLATSTPKKNAPKLTTVFDRFCIEQTTPTLKKRKKSVDKLENDDFVDVESLNDATIPVLEANNVGSLLEQFEASEKINVNVRKKPHVKIKPEVKSKTKDLAFGMRLQAAAVQLHKNKMRQILMSTPSSNSTVVKKSQTVHFDHDYCSTKKRHSLPVSLKNGQSLLKPEVLSSNHQILSSRHRTCKNKKIVYNLSSDDETTDVRSNSKIKTSVKPIVKKHLFSNHRKKLSPLPSVTNTSSKEKSNISVISNSASKASDNCSQSSGGSIKLTIKNKSKVILKIDCNDKTNSPHKIAKPERAINTSDKPYVTELLDKKKNIDEKCKPIDSNISTIEANSVGTQVSTDVIIKTEARPEKEDFYTALFKNKQDIQITLPEPVIVKNEIETVDSIVKQEIVDVAPPQNVNVEVKPIKKKLNLQEYKLRREGANSNGSSRTVSPEAIFPDMPGSHNLDKIQIIEIQTSPSNEIPYTTEKVVFEAPKKIFDPIKEASRKILANNAKKHKAEATRKRDENIVMRQIPKVANLQLQPLISDTDMMKMVGIVPSVILPKDLTEKPKTNDTVIMKMVGIIPSATLPNDLAEKPKSNIDYEEIVLVSVGTNTDKAIFKQMKKAMDNMKKEIEKEKVKCQSPPSDKATVNFKIKKSENVLKQNVFDSVKKDNNSEGTYEKRHASPIKEAKIDKERFKGITAALKSVKKQVVTKISSNSLFATIQDTVMKKAPDDSERTEKKDERKSKLLSPVEKKSFFRSNSIKTAIVREYDPKNEHGEDKIILHLEKNRSKPVASNMIIQTDLCKEFSELEILLPEKVLPKTKESSFRRRTVSNMSSSTGDSAARKLNNSKDKTIISEEKAKIDEKPKSEEPIVSRTEKRLRSIDQRSRSRNRKSRSKHRYETKYRRRSRSRSRRSRSRSRRRCRPSSRRSRSRSRSRSRGRSRSRTRGRSCSRSRGRSRSVDRYRRYRRSDSHYKYKKRSRSPYRRSSSRRSRSRKRDYRSNRTRSRSRKNSYRCDSPVVKKIKSTPEKDPKTEKKLESFFTPPMRKHSVSSSSESSTRSCSSSDSSSSSSSNNTSGSRSPSKSQTGSTSPTYKKQIYPAYSSEARECNTPVEERRIVFVGKLEKDITKFQLRSMFMKFGPILEVTLHSKEDGCRYGFVTFRMGRDAWSAVEAASSFPKYDVGFGGRRAFCRQRYADLDGLEVKYTESAYMGQPTMQPVLRTADDMSFEQMLLDMKNKLSQRKKTEDSKP